MTAKPTLTPHELKIARYTLYAFSYAGFAALAGFSIARLIWDLDITHFADVQPWRYYNIPLLAVGRCPARARARTDTHQVYVLSMLLFTGVLIARGVFCCRKKPAPAWVDDTGIWSAALSIALTTLGVVPLVYDLWWDFEGSYPPPLIGAMIGINLFDLAINSVLFFYLD